MLNVKRAVDVLLKRTNELLAKEMKKDTDNAFKTKSWDNKSWKPKKNGNIPSLVKSGKLKNTIKFKTDRKGVEVTTQPYGKYQNENGRQFVGLEDNRNLKNKMDIMIAREMDIVMLKILK